MDIQVTVTSQYGREVIKPHCYKARVFADMLGQTTLTRRNIDYIKQLGYEIRVVQLTPEVLL